jgi:hypothetical protein
MRIVQSVSQPIVNYLADRWQGRLAHYRLHKNDEHRAALFDEAIRYAGLHLENDLSRSDYWSMMPLHQRAIVLLVLVDRGAVERTVRHGRRVYEPLPHAESWAQGQPALRPYLKQTLEMLSALRHELIRRSHSSHA